jgi:hypothetical protein
MTRVGVSRHQRGWGRDGHPDSQAAISRSDSLYINNAICRGGPLWPPAFSFDDLRPVIRRRFIVTTRAGVSRPQRGWPETATPTGARWYLKRSHQHRWSAVIVFGRCIRGSAARCGGPHFGVQVITEASRSLNSKLTLMVRSF